MKDFLFRMLKELGADRFRTFLSLLGVSIGIFSIVSSLALVNSVERCVREAFESFGSDLLFIDKEPLEPDLNEDGVFRWWEYASRPMPSFQEFRFLRERGEGSYASIAFAAYGSFATGVAGDWRLLARQSLSEGREFSPQELERGAPVALVGSEVERDASVIRIDGALYRIIGVFEKCGVDSVSPVDIDHCCLVPYGALQGPVMRSSILVSGADESTLRSLLRQFRRLPVAEADNFSFNRLSFLLDEMDGIFRMISKLGWIVGLFSLLVGGFGVANVLFVSVEERKPQIGICRALGAKRRVIIFEYLSEAAMLSMLGGLLGIVLSFIAVCAVRLLVASAITLSLSPDAMIAGLSVSLLIGLLFGVAPAYYAAKLDPAEAMRS